MMLGEQIRALRKERGLTQSQLAQEIGTSQTTISECENDGFVAQKTKKKVLQWLKGCGVEERPFCIDTDCGGYDIRELNCCSILKGDVALPCKFKTSRAEWERNNRIVCGNLYSSSKTKRAINRDIAEKKAFWENHPLKKQQ